MGSSIFHPSQTLSKPGTAGPYDLPALFLLTMNDKVVIFSKIISPTLPRYFGINQKVIAEHINLAIPTLPHRGFWLHMISTRFLTRGPLVLYRSPECWGYTELGQTWNYMNIQCFISCDIQKHQEQIWPCHKNGQGQTRVIIWKKAPGRGHTTTWYKFWQHFKAFKWIQNKKGISTKFPFTQSKLVFW